MITAALAASLRGKAAMLDFRFLISAILAGVLLAVIGLRAFGPVDPLIATIAERPHLETKAAPRIVPSRGFIPASYAAQVLVPVQTPVMAVPVGPALTATAVATEPDPRPAVPEIAVAVEPVFRSAVPEIATAVEPVSGAAVPEIAGKPEGKTTAPEITDSPDAAATQIEGAPPAKRKRRIAAPAAKKEEELNPVLLFFSKYAKVR